MPRFFSFLRSSTLVVPLLVLAGWLTPRAAHASHALGADMSYVNVSPGVYYVQVRFYRDCSGISAPPDIQLAYEGTGCGLSGTGTNGGSSIRLTARGMQTGNPYCRQQNLLSPCDTATGIPSNGLPNYQIFTYGRVMALGSGPATECSAWILSTAINARPGTQNLGYGGTLYTYALLNNRDLPDDSSPAFSIFGGLQPLAVMYENTLVRYNSAVVDADGDSLVYSMQPSLSGPNAPVAYVNGHSLQNPIRLMAGSSPLRLDQQGTLEFTAGTAIIGSSNDEDNKFAVVIQVDAWRRINGQAVLTGRVRREIAAVIAHSPGGVNIAPHIPGGMITVTRTDTTQVISYGDTINAYAGEALVVDVGFMDLNGDSIFVEMPAALSPAGSTMGIISSVQAGGISMLMARITWTPTAADVRSQAHSFYLRVKDNGCPNASSAFYPLSVMVAALRPLGLPAGAVARPALRAAPNPFATATRLSVTTTTADPTDAAVSIYDLTGRLVDRLRVPAGAGTHELTWHAPAALPAGVYLARFRGAGRQPAIRLVKE